MEFILNSTRIQTELPNTTRVIDFLRKEAGLKGTKEGCREGDCGACTVLLGEQRSSTVEYSARVSCLLMLGQCEGRHLVTIEGLNSGAKVTPVQRAMVEAGAIQCGFCTPGIVMALTGFALEFSSGSSFRDALRSLDGNLCRCTGYQSIARAARQVCDLLEGGADVGIDNLISKEIVPDYFARIPERLDELGKYRHGELASRCPGKDGSLSTPAERVIVAGGTDFAVRESEDPLGTEIWLLNDELPGTVEEDDVGLRMSATLTFEKFARSRTVQEYLPHIQETMGSIASTPIRNAATIGGNIVNGSPAADLGVLLLSLDAELSLRNGATARVVKLTDFYTGYKQNLLERGEWVEWVRIPRILTDYQKNFEKVSKRTHLDIATVNTGCSILIKSNMITKVIISAGGVAPHPLILKDVCRFLEGKSLSVQNVRQAAALAEKEISPIDDIRGSGAYKRRLLRQLIFAHFSRMFGLQTEEPDHVS